MAIVGLDLGYTYTKTNTGVIFPSKITQVEPIMGGNSIFLKDKTYYVGDGKGTLEINKIDEVITDVCLMYALSKCYDGSDFDIVTGLPISQYKTQKNQMKRMLLNHDKTYITVNDCVYPISIRNAEVYPQAAGALQSANILSDAIVIDIGGRTVDIAYFDYLSDKRKLVNSSTLFGGMLALYSRIIEAVNLKYDTTLPVEYAEKILTRGLMYKGEMQDISFLKPIIAEHIMEICDEVTVKYPYKSTKMYLCGGGSSIIFNPLKKFLGDLEVLENAQFANAVGFYKVGCKLWKK